MKHLNLLAKGNKKMDKSVFNWSITPIESCPNCKDCAKTCYARFPYYYYKVTKKAWDRNFALAKSGEFKKHIINQLKKSRICEFVRIHTSGDFFSQQYINDWKEIIETFPNIKFYTYTKTLHLFDFSEITSLPNFNLINSIAFDGGLNYGDKNRVKFLQSHGYIVCPATISQENKEKFHCGSTCFICMKKKKVCFYQHK